MNRAALLMMIGGQLGMLDEPTKPARQGTLSTIREQVRNDKDRKAAAEAKRQSRLARNREA